MAPLHAEWRLQGPLLAPPCLAAALPKAQPPPRPRAPPQEFKIYTADSGSEVHGVQYGDDNVVEYVGKGRLRALGYLLLSWVILFFVGALAAHVHDRHTMASSRGQVPSMLSDVLPGCSRSYDPKMPPGKARMCPEAFPRCIGLNESEMQLGTCKPKEKERRAFVMMSWDAPHRPHGEHLWGVVAMARALQKLSPVKVLLLTNTTHFVDGTEVASSFRRLHVEVLPVTPVRPLNGEAWRPEDLDLAFWKLQLWSLTDYDKVLWLDSDAIAYRSLDWIFKHDGLVAARDDRYCRLNQSDPSTALLLLQPSMVDYNGMLDLTRNAALPLTYDQVVGEYFRQVKRQNFTLLNDVDAAYGQCLGKARSFYLNGDGSSVHGVWNMPAFVHRSGGSAPGAQDVHDNVCFQPNVTRQKYVVGEREINVCHYHPLGAWWRELFCEAVVTLGLQRGYSRFRSYCSAFCYYGGSTDEEGQACDESSAALTSHVDQVLPDKDYNRRTRRMPASEVLRLQAVYRSVGGVSGPDFAHALRFQGARLPQEAPLTITARIHTSSQAVCQNIVAWPSTALGSMEFRVNNGQLLYGESSGGNWSDVDTRDLKLADGVWHTVCVVRDEEGWVTLYSDGRLVQRGRLHQRRLPGALSADAISARAGLFEDCVFQGEVSELSVYNLAMNLDQLAAVTLV